MLAIPLRKPHLHLDVLLDGILALLQVSIPSVSLSAFDYTWFPDLSFRFVDNYCRTAHTGSTPLSGSKFSDNVYTS